MGCCESRSLAKSKQQKAGQPEKTAAGNPQGNSQTAPDPPNSDPKNHLFVHPQGEHNASIIDVGDYLQDNLSSPVKKDEQDPLEPAHVPAVKQNALGFGFGSYQFKPKKPMHSVIAEVSSVMEADSKKGSGPNSAEIQPKGADIYKKEVDILKKEVDIHNNPAEVCKNEAAVHKNEADDGSSGRGVNRKEADMNKNGQMTCQTRNSVERIHLQEQILQSYHPAFQITLFQAALTAHP